MRYELFFTCSLFGLPYSLFPAPCSVRVAWPTASVPAPKSLKTVNLYITSS
ncbi:hypothetical protein [Moorena producens]|uniref:hypothetical protein n=1 Tax=Moorena producens TaxID=1155739 RepID=UPI00131484F0|nr:hypothetical protein [Moorena producens]